MNAFPDVHYRYIIVPSKPMGGGTVPLNFTPSNIEFEIQLGYNDTISYLNNDLSGRTIIQELFEKNQAKIIYP